MSKPQRSNKEAKKQAVLAPKDKEDSQAGEEACR